jgi:hypothetical protein
LTEPFLTVLLPPSDSESPVVFPKNVLEDDNGHINSGRPQIHVDDITHQLPFQSQSSNEYLQPEPALGLELDFNVNSENQMSSDGDMINTSNSEDLQNSFTAPPDISSFPPHHLYIDAGIPISTPLPSTSNNSASSTLHNNRFQGPTTFIPASGEQENANIPVGYDLTIHMFGAEDFLPPSDFEFSGNEATRTEVPDIQPASIEALDVEPPKVGVSRGQTTTSFRSKRSRQGTVDSAKTLTQVESHYSSLSPTSMNTTKPPRKRQRPDEPTLVQADSDAESIFEASQIVRENKKVRQLVLHWRKCMADRHPNDAYKALLECLNDRAVCNELMSNNPHDHELEQSLSTPAFITSQSALQVAGLLGRNITDVLHRGAFLSERQAMKQRAIDPPADVQDKTEYSLTSRPSISVPYNYNLSIGAATPSSSSSNSHLKADFQWPLAGTGCYPTPAATTPASSHAPISACSSVGSGPESLVPMCSQHETVRS